MILESLNLESASAKLYVFCEAGCDHSLFKDLAGDAHRKEAVQAVRGLWPKIVGSFALLWRDIPIAAWKRLIHSSRYLRSLLGSARHQAKAYGGANYFWSVAIAAAVASFSRDIKTLFLFEKNGTTLFKRVAQAFSGYRSLQSTQRLEKRILFRTLAGDDGFEKLSKRTHTRACSKNG